MQRKILLAQGWEMDDQDQITALMGEIRDLPIDEVMARYGVRPERYLGSRILALCPFHMDEHIGSFSIDTEKGLCWCFACNTGGDVIHSMSKIWHRPIIDTALQIGADFGILTKEEYQAMSGKDYSDSFLDKKSDYKPLAQEKKRPDKETLEIWTKVYEFMRDRFGVSEEDRKYLKEVRKLSDERIDRDYFSIDTTDPKVVSRLIFDLRSKMPDIGKVLSTVPGFYEELKKDLYRVSMLAHKGIAIILRDAEMYAIAIQVRSREDRPDKSSRYRYLSYRCTPNSRSRRGGGTVGTPVDVLFPETIGKKGRISIVEGRFKSEILAKSGFISLSVQGVNNFAGIEKDIEAAEEVSKAEIRDIYVFYDADQLRNGAVFGAGVKLSRYLKEKTDKNVFFVIWDPEKGKGIDDLIFAGGRDSAKPFDADFYAEVYEAAHAAAEEESGLDLKNLAKLSKADRSRFYDIFEREAREKFNLI